jgi:hypothetical protein
VNAVHLQINAIKTIIVKSLAQKLPFIVLIYTIRSSLAAPVRASIAPLHLPTADSGE